MAQRYAAGERIWHAIYQEVVTVESVDPRMHGDDDYWVRDGRWALFMATDSELEPLEVPNA